MSISLKFAHSCLKSITSILILASLILNLLSIPLGIFIIEGFSDATLKTNLWYFYFLLFEIIYSSCFVFALKSGEGFRKSLNEFIHKPIAFPLGNFLLLMPVITSLTHAALNLIELIQNHLEVSTGFPPLAPDPLQAYFELAWSSITEEVVFRAVLLGVFYLFYLNRSIRKASVRKKLSISLLSFLSPESAKKLLRSWGSSMSSKIEIDEWVIIVFSSALFAFSHYSAPNAWGVGKLTLAFVQGFAMALSYIFYGIHASILIHGYFNYYVYTNRLIANLQPNLSFLSLFSEALSLVLTILTLMLLTISKMKSVSRAGLSIFREKRRQFFRMLKSEAHTMFKRASLAFRFSREKIPDLTLISIVVFTLGLRFAIVEFPKRVTTGETPSWDLIFDEQYYVVAAREMLHGEAVNNEHPPLAKFLIAASILLLGDNPVGWRISAILASSVSIVLLYVLSLRVFGRKDVSVYSAMLFAFDIMVFNIGQIAILDAPAMMFMLAASIMILKGRYDLGGLFLGLSSLCKLTSTLFCALIPTFLVVIMQHEKKTFKEVAKSFLRSILIALVVFLAGLWVYDSWYSVFRKNPLEHILYMTIYHSSLKYQDPGDVILPLQWINPLNPFIPMPLYVMTCKGVIGGVLREYNAIAYYGIYTPLWWSIWVVMPLILLKAFREFRKGSCGKTSLFIFTWILAGFLPYVVLAYFMSRWVYPFYFYSVLPGLYMGLSSCLSDKYSKTLSTAAILLQAFWFILWFPVKPKAIIDLFISLGLPV